MKLLRRSSLPLAPPATKYCIQCGAQIPMEAVRCPKCGGKQ